MKRCARITPRMGKGRSFERPFHCENPLRVAGCLCQLSLQADLVALSATCRALTVNIAARSIFGGQPAVSLAGGTRFLADHHDHLPGRVHFATASRRHSVSDERAKAI